MDGALCPADRSSATTRTADCYRVAARNANSADTSASNIGFRVVDAG
jgi:formylglycine-generating enzyme required for sulfatase activity